MDDPLGRDPARVRADVIDDYVSIEVAHDVYGVVFTTDSRDASLDVDDEATARLRARIRAARGVAGA